MRRREVYIRWIMTELFLKSANIIIAVHKYIDRHHKIQNCFTQYQFDDSRISISDSILVNDTPSVPQEYALFIGHGFNTQLVK